MAKQQANSKTPKQQDQEDTPKKGTIIDPKEQLYQYQPQPLSSLDKVDVKGINVNVKVSQLVASIISKFK